MIVVHFRNEETRDTQFEATFCGDPIRPAR